MDAGATPRRGLADSLRQLGATVVGIAEVRLALLGTEFEQEKARVAGGLFLGAVALLLLFGAVAMLSILLVMLASDAQRPLVVGLLAALYAGAGGWLLRRAARRLRSPQDGVLGLSVAELRRDRAHIDGTAP